MSDYKNINDYELLYLINEGNEYALDYFTNKYFRYIDYIIFKYYFDCDKNDLREIGNTILDKCIKSYNDTLNVMFKSYFAISFRREINRYLVNNDNLVYDDNYLYTCLEEESLIPGFNGISLKGKYFFKDRIHIDLFEECLIGGNSLIEFSKKYKYTYYYVYSEYQKMVAILKKTIL